jgi:teichuronic acid biosynthesis glycosyltransferase TuaC
MRVIFVTKRQYMQKDVIDDCYARLYELPNQLAQQGHQVLGICLSYRKRQESIFQHYQEGNSVLSWHSYNLGILIIPGLIRYIYSVISMSRTFKPDIILGSSDCPMVILTAFFFVLDGYPLFY